MNWQTVTIWTVVALVILGGLLFAAYRWGVAVTERDIALSPVHVEIVERVDTVKVPEIRVDTVKVSHIDTVQSEPCWYQAQADTTIDGVHLQMAYNSPLPLSVRGYFSDIAIQLPPRLDTVRVEYVTRTVTIVEERIAWEWVVAGASVGVVAGFLIDR